MSFSFSNNFGDSQYKIILNTPTEDKPTPLIESSEVDYISWFVWKLNLANKKIEKLKAKLLNSKSTAI